MTELVTDVLAGIETALAAFEVPGLAVAVIREDELIVAEGYGVRALDARASVDGNTLFAIGSISKSFTALALAMLVDEGRLDWDHAVIDYLPEFRLADPWATREITVRDLLIHRSGLRQVSGGTIWYGSRYDRAAVIRRLRHLQPVTSFRSCYAYQNITYLVAGEIVPAITGMTWDAFVEERIFAPLGMHRSVTSVESLDLKGNVVTPHARVGGIVRPVQHRNYDNVAPAASIYASAVDMAQYMRLLLGGGVFQARPLIGEATARELFAAQTVIPIMPFPAPLTPLTPKFLVYALGWFVRDYHGRRLVYHSGGVDGMTSLLCMLPEEQIGVVVLTNQQEGIVGSAAYGIIDALMGLPPVDRVTPMLEVRAAQHERERVAQTAHDAGRVPGTTPSLPLDRYTGLYNDPAYGTVEVALEAGRLILRMQETPTFSAELDHWHYDTFRSTWHDVMVPPGLVSFVLDATADVRELRFDQPRLLDVDFAELQPTRRASEEAPARH